MPVAADADGSTAATGPVAVAFRRPPPEPTIRGCARRHAEKLPPFQPTVAIADAMAPLFDEWNAPAAGGASPQKIMEELERMVGTAFAGWREIPRIDQIEAW